MLNPIKILVLTTRLEVDDAQKILNSFLFILATLFFSKNPLFGEKIHFMDPKSPFQNYHFEITILIWMSDHHSGSKIKYFTRVSFKLIPHKNEISVVIFSDITFECEFRTFLPKNLIVLFYDEKFRENFWNFRWKNFKPTIRLWVVEAQ